MPYVIKHAPKLMLNTTCDVTNRAFIGSNILRIECRFVKEETVCMALVVFGASIYAVNDLSYDKVGYMWMFANTAMFVSSQLYEKYAVVALDQSAVGISCIRKMSFHQVL